MPAENIRRAAVAGRFYPADPEELKNLLSSLFESCVTPAGPAPKAIIAPHAGYVFSGPIAASAYALFQGDREIIKRIVLLGPSHYVGFRGLAASSATAFATPLGLVPVDHEAVRATTSLPQVRLLDQAHQLEHALEVQLPFLQVLLPQFTVVPLVVGDAQAEDIARVLEALWGGPETRFVVSSDLSHYLPWEAAREIDARTARAIEALDFQGLGEQQACGRIPVLGLLCAARKRGLRARTVDLRNSGDTAGPRHQVVGYGAFAFDAPSGATA